jgi:acetyl-CoA synthetase (ADP-forming)
MEEILNAEKSFAILKKNSIPFAEWKIAKTAQSAAAAAKKLGFPVAMKALSKKIIHKSDTGFVKLNIEEEKHVGEAFDELSKKASKIRAKLDGVLLQKMEKGTEVIIGLKTDPQFGPVVIFGLGGIFVEVIKDVSMRIAPLKKEDCLGMIMEIKGYKILRGARGRKPANMDALVKILMAVSRIGRKNKKITEIDLNPVIVNESSAKVVDVRIMSEK